MASHPDILPMPRPEPMPVRWLLIHYRAVIEGDADLEATAEEQLRRLDIEPPLYGRTWLKGPEV